MTTSPATRQSILLRIRDTDDTLAWHEFVGIYAPLIHAYAMRRGLQDSDAADVAQLVLQSISRAIPEFVYDRTRGSFRAWLYTLTRNQIFKFLRQQQRAPLATGDSAFHNALHQIEEDTQSDEDIWNQEHELQLFDWAVEKARIDFRQSTWRAFWSVAVEGQPVANVAKELDLSPGAVYIAKSRVTARIRHLIDSVEDT